MNAARRLLTWLLIVLAGAATLMVLLSYGQRLDWRLDLIAHLRPQLGLCLVLAATVQLLLKPPWLAAAWASAAAMAWLPVAPLYLPANTVGGEASLTVIHANVSGNKLEASAFFDFLRDDPPDLLLLQEVTPETLDVVASELPDYERLAAVPRRDTRGTAAYARRGVEASAGMLYPTPDRDRPFPQVSLRVGGRDVSLFHFSATRPLPGERFADQGPAYDAAAAWANATRLSGVTPIVIGDFNSTPQGVRPRYLAARTNLRFAAEGHGNRGTWHARLPAVARLPIDYALMPRDWHVETFDVGPYVGGDHRPIRLSLGVPANTVP